MSEEILDMPLFAGCDRATVGALLDRMPGRPGIYRKGEYLALQNDPCRSLFLLGEGRVQAVVTSEEGRELTFDALSAPDVLASPFLFSSGALYPVSIVALSDCRTWILGRECVRSLVEQDRAVLHNFLSILSDHSIFLTSRLKEFALQTLTSRLLGYLEKNGVVQNLQQTAFVLGVTRPSLSRALSQLVRQGVIRRTEAGYVLM